MNTFAIKIAKNAVKVKHEDLSPEERKDLFDNRQYDPQKDEIYSFKVGVVITSSQGKKKTAAKRDFKRADTMLVGLRDFSGFLLTGIHPLSEEYERTATRETGVEGEVGAGIKLFSASLKPVGRAKEEIKYKRTSILQSFDETYAQWVFLKLYLEKHLDYKLLLAVQKDAAQPGSLSFICEVDVQEKNRSLLSNTAQKKVECVDKS